MDGINEGFARLGEIIPKSQGDKRLSKIKTLQTASLYINQLIYISNQNCSDDENNEKI